MQLKNGTDVNKMLFICYSHVSFSQQSVIVYIVWGLIVPYKYHVYHQIKIVT